MKIAVEIHDSTIVSIAQHVDKIIVELDAIVHRSNGRPGIDSGTVWKQSVRLTFSKGKISGNPETVPETLFDGTLTLDQRTYENCFAVPLSHTGRCVAQFELPSDRLIVVEAKSVYVRDYWSTNAHRRVCSVTNSCMMDRPSD